MKKPWKLLPVRLFFMPGWEEVVLGENGIQPELDTRVRRIYFYFRKP